MLTCRSCGKPCRNRSPDLRAGVCNACYLRRRRRAAVALAAVDFNGPGRPPTVALEALPGSAERLEELAGRVQRRETLSGLDAYAPDLS